MKQLWNQKEEQECKELLEKSIIDMMNEKLSSKYNYKLEWDIYPDYKTSIYLGVINLKIYENSELKYEINVGDTYASDISFMKADDNIVEDWIIDDWFENEEKIKFIVENLLRKIKKIGLEKENKIWGRL